MRFLTFLLATVTWAQAVVPRPAPDLRITDPSGHILSLSAYHGRVVLLAFILTTCSHCKEASKGFEQLLGELGPRGLEVLEAAFDEHADVADYRKQLGVSFPVGVSSRERAFAFLGISGNRRIGTPQVVLIDRAGIIRAQSAPEGSPMLQSVDVLRSLIKGLL